MKSYISLISKYRAKLEIDFEKNQNKFFNNSVFDRKIQNDRKQRDVQLITNEKQKKDSLLQETLREVNMYEIFLEYFE